MTINGEVIFKSDFGFLEMESLEILNQEPEIYPGISKAVINSSYSKGIQLEVNVTNFDDTRSKALKNAKEFASYVGNAMTFHITELMSSEFDCFVSFKYERDTLVDDKPKQGLQSVSLSASIGGSASMGAKSNVYIGLNTQERREQLKDYLQNNQNNNLFYYRQFYDALNLEGTVGKFMALYNLLLFTQNDSQKQVDQFVIQDCQDKGYRIPMHTYRDRNLSGQLKTRNETIYTKLRNQIGHIRDGVTFSQTRTEMDANMQDLIKLVRKAISQYSRH